MSILTTRTLRLALTVSFISGSLFVLGVAPAGATFIIDTSCGVSTCAAGDHFNIDKANHNVSTFTGKTDGFGVTVDTTGKVDTGGGFATITPHGTGTLTELIFTPANDLAFNDFSFRGQVVDDGTVIDVDVVDQNGTTSCDGPPPTGAVPCDFTIAMGNQDFNRMGITASSGSGETIKEVIITATLDGFKEFKQVEFSLAPGVTPVPEPTTLSLLGIGLVGLGLAGRRKRRRRAA
jgi:hypothetical protein